MKLSPSTSAHRPRENGMALLIVLMLLGAGMLLGTTAAQLALLGERGARNERDMQLAWHAAQAALLDAESELANHPHLGAARSHALQPESAAFLAGCGSDAADLGLCASQDHGMPTWLQVDFHDAASPSVPYGRFTQRSWPMDTHGIPSPHPPRYIIERLPIGSVQGDASIQGQPQFAYRITAMGFGPRPDIQAITQSVFRP
jgi:type IV pilus assembly protein PilX